MKKGEKLESIIHEMYPLLSMNKFADMAGVKRTTMHDIIKKEDLGKVSIENIQLIARALGCSVEELLYRLENNVSMKERLVYKAQSEVKENCEQYFEQLQSEKTSTLKYFGAVSAGKVELVEGIESAETIRLPKAFLGKHQDKEGIFIMKVNGESMNKVLPVDSLVVCLPVNDMNEIKDNDIVIFSYNNEMAVKRFKITEDNLVFSPQSTNDHFFDIVIPKETDNDVKIIAKVISYHVCLD